MAFIPVDKIKKLRESAKLGDLIAKKILDMQLNGTEDFGPLMNEYFSAPKVEENPIVKEQTITEAAEPIDTPYQTYLKENGLEHSEDIAKEFTEATGQKAELGENINNKDFSECEELVKTLMKEELDAINSYSKAITHVMSSENLNDNQKRKIITRFEEIKSDETEHYAELKQLFAILENKTENVE